MAPAMKASSKAGGKAMSKGALVKQLAEQKVPKKKKPEVAKKTNTGTQTDTVKRPVMGTDGTRGQKMAPDMGTEMGEMADGTRGQKMGPDMGTEMGEMAWEGWWQWLRDVSGVWMHGTWHWHLQGTQGYAWVWFPKYQWELSAVRLARDGSTRNS